MRMKHFLKELAVERRSIEGLSAMKEVKEVAEPAKAAIPWTASDVYTATSIVWFVLETTEWGSRKHF